MSRFDNNVPGATLIIVALILAFVITENRARSQAVAFCVTVQPGSSFTEIAEQLEEHVDERQLHREVDLLTVSFNGAFPFIRHICEIEGAEGKVVRSRYVWEGQ